MGYPPWGVWSDALLPQHCRYLLIPGVICAAGPSALALLGLTARLGEQFDRQLGLTHVLLGFCLHGSAVGRCGSRAIRTQPKQLAWIGAPGDRLRLSVQSPELSALLLAVPVATLINTHRASACGDGLDLSALVEGSALPAALLWPLAAQLSTLRAQPTAVLQRQQCEALEQALITLLAAQLSSPSANAVSDGLAQRHVLSALSYCQAHLGEAASAEAMATNTAVGLRRLQASCLAVLQCSPLEMLQVLRLQQMQQALLNGASAQAACSSAGLGFTGHTAKAFRDLYGQTPRDLRCAVAAGRADAASFLVPYPASRTWLLLSRINAFLECESSSAQPCDPAPLSTSRPS